MKYLFKQIKIADPRSSYFNKVVDVLVKDGVIKKIDAKIATEKSVNETIDCKGVTVFPGFCDLHSHFCDPGYESREDIISGSKVAIAGGYTAVATIPNCSPITNSKAQIEYQINKAAKTPIDIYPLGAVTEDLKNNSPTEIYDMNAAGAVAFTNAPNSINNNGVLSRALQYTNQFKGVVIICPLDTTLSVEGQINEGVYSVKLGMKGIANEAEIIAVKNAIDSLAYAGGRLHLSGISCIESIKLIKAAKRSGLNITASTYAHLIHFNEKVVSDYDTSYKVLPPFRKENDRKALIKAIEDGIIDIIESQHTPIETEHKKVEFENAEFGIIGLQTAFSVVQQYFTAKKANELLANIFSINPRAIINKPTEQLEINSQANFTFVNLKETWEFNATNNLSKCNNSPFLGTTLKGKIFGILNKGKFHYA